MKTKSWEELNTSYARKAKPLEDEALLLKSKHLKGSSSINPERIGKMYEDAGDLRRKAHDFIGAQDDYLEANKYGYAYSSADSERVRNKINGLISEKRQAQGLPLRSSLEKRSSFETVPQRLWAYLSIISLAAALLSISLKWTGSVVGPAATNNKWIGLCLFLVGCMFTFFYFRTKRK